MCRSRCRSPGRRCSALRRPERLKRLKEAKERLQREAEAAAKAVQEHMEQRRAEEEATGKKKRGRKPKVVEPLPTEEAKANTTDPDSLIIKTRQGYVQGYNAQAVVSEEQIIVAVGVTQEANDVQQLEPMLQAMAHTKRTEPEGQDGAQAADKARPSSAQEAGRTGGASVRTGQGRTRVSTVYETGSGCCTE